MEKEKILSKLCQHFRLKPASVTYIESVEMFFVYRYVVRSTGQNGIEAVLLEITRLSIPIRTRHRRQRLHELFAFCQIKNVQECGRYDTTATQPPVAIPWHTDLEY